MRLTAITPQTILPMPNAEQHTLAATWALARAEHLMNPVGIPEDPPAPDTAGARDAFQEAINQLEQARTYAGNRPGYLHLEAAIDQAREALRYLDRPGVAPPVAIVTEHAHKGADLTREALRLLIGADVWPMVG